MNIFFSPRTSLGAVLAMTTALGCARLERVREARIETAGISSLAIGQVTTITATTVNGTDDSYTFTSNDTTIATVEADGSVTGVAPGETTVTVTGNDTNAQGAHVVVVLPLSDSQQVPFFTAWLSSAHADASSEAYTHFEEDGEVSTACATCHAGSGFVDFVGGDGTAAGSVENAAPVGDLIDCNACHNDAANALSSVTFPSGVVVDDLGGESRCMTCHQGRHSTDSVDAQIADAMVTGDDEVSSELGFSNIHYYPAAATLYAGQVRGGYQYNDGVYDVRFRHAEGFNRCTDCHDAHSLQVRFDQCVSCHPNASDLSGAQNIRMIASRNQDYDGDGNTTEGIYYEIQGLRAQLLALIARYASERSAAICYANAYPYWFKDLDSSGTCEESESNFGNRYDQWTPRLVRATYNYQMASKEPGGFAHNAKYIIQLLHDSLQDINNGVAVQDNLSALVRNDIGHFNGVGTAARFWDEDESIQSSCSECHSGETGFRFFVEFGVGVEVPETANGLECSTCHDDVGGSWSLLQVADTTFPGPTVLQLPGADNLCSNCHSGRQSTLTIDAVLARGPVTAFQNVHYFAAAGVLNGSEAGVGYEYSGQTYVARFQHTGGAQCTSCHDAVASNHTFTIADAWDTRCDTCHADAGSAINIRINRTTDYDGDGSNTETLDDELSGMAAKVLGAINTIAAAPGICYGDSYPYFFADTDDDNAPSCSPTEGIFPNRWTQWDPALLKAAHNYQLYAKSPGAYAHNFDYMAQLLYDSVFDIRGNSDGMTRP